MVKFVKTCALALLALVLPHQKNSLVSAKPRSYYFKSLIDHVTDLDGTSGNRFDLRYIVDDQYWKAGNGESNLIQPIFFYAG